MFRKNIEFGGELNRESEGTEIQSYNNKKGNINVGLIKN